MTQRATPFTIEVPGAVLDDLRSRLRNSGFTRQTRPEPWSRGADPGYLREFAASWAQFDWSAAQARLNGYPQFVADVGGAALHFVHLRADDPAPRPALLLCHGWPSTFAEMLPLAELLRADFDVVIPSLPGFLWSELPDRPLTRRAIADSLHELMTEVLGYESYGAFGGDIGGAAVAWLGALHPESVTAIHLIHPPFPAEVFVPVTPEEEAFFELDAEYDETDGGYSAIMGTRPDTIAAALADSPIGLAAWIIDKYRDWSDCGGDVETRFNRATLCTIATLYWVTGSIGSSFQQYADWDANTPRPMITVPAAFTLSTEPSMVGFPRSIAEASFTNIVRWSEPGTGGHFLPFEEPELMAAELRATFG